MDCDIAASIIQYKFRGFLARQITDEPNDTTGSARPVVERFIESRHLVSPQRSASSAATSVDDLTDVRWTTESSINHIPLECDGLVKSLS